MATREQCEAFFRDADKDSDNFLTYEEMANMMRSQGFKGTDEQIKKFFIVTDTSGDNRISLEEYLDVMGQIPPQTSKEASMRQVFRSFDKDGNGVIDRCELKAVLEELGRTFAPEEIKRMMSLMDKNDDGLVDYEEFIEYMFSVADSGCSQQQ